MKNKIFRVQEPWVYLLGHFAIAAFFFSNFFLFGQVLVASTDMLIINFPMMIQAKRSLLQGEIPLWNPYVMGGVSNFLCGVAPFFSPENWIHFLVPEKYFFVLGTFLQFIRLSLVGGVCFLALFRGAGESALGLFCGGLLSVMWLHALDDDRLRHALVGHVFYLGDGFDLDGPASSRLPPVFVPQCSLGADGPFQ